MRLAAGQQHLAEAEFLLDKGLVDIALLMAETALVNGADAVLRLHGFEVNSHAARFAYPGLPLVYQQNRGHLSRIRTARNASQYEAAESVSAQLARQAVALARRALEAVRPLVSRE